jgi:hypothetical protein
MVNLKNGNKIIAKITEYGCISVLVLTGEIKGKKTKKKNKKYIPLLKFNSYLFWGMSMLIIYIKILIRLNFIEVCIKY